MFERCLEQNLRRSLADREGLRIQRIRGRALVRADCGAEALIEPASKVFGVVSLSPAVEASREPAALTATVLETTAEALQRDYPGTEVVPFRVRVNRADKSFPMTSMALEKELGAKLLDHFPRLSVDLTAASLTVEVDIRGEGVWVFARRQAGPGGLPVGSLGKGLCLLSGGIDSPVAAWMAMKRGIRVEFISFYSFPYVGPQLKEKLLRLIEGLTPWQPQALLHMVPFTAYQEQIRDLCPSRYRTVLYRRAMQRIACKMAWRRRCRVLITGESVGQVASQTLENLTLIQQAGDLPVIRPLVCFDKQEAIALARKIGTYEISKLPAEDSCTVFQPEAPIIYGRHEEVEAAEAGLDLDTLTAEAVRGTERLRIPEDS